MDGEFRNLSEEEIIRLAGKGNQDATEYMLKKYSPLVKKSIRTLYLIGADTEDLSQEGMIGLFKAVQNYRDGNTASFYTFAKVCIDRGMQMDIDDSIAVENELFAMCFATKDQKEGMGAFLEKRSAQFTNT